MIVNPAGKKTAGAQTSATEVVANLGVILAGVLVWWTGSRYSSLVIEMIIGLMVLNGARKILALNA